MRRLINEYMSSQQITELRDTEHVLLETSISIDGQKQQTKTASPSNYLHFHILEYAAPSE